MRRTGVVMELEPKSAIVLTPEGEFCRVPRVASMDLGATVHWETAPFTAQPPIRRNARRGRRTVWQRASVAGLAACLAVAAGLWLGAGPFHPATAEAYAFVSVDINPSVTLQVDQHLHVQQADGTNADGKSILAKLHVKGEPLNQAIEQIVQEAAADGMMSPKEAILVSTAPGPVTKDVSQVEQQAKQAVQTAIADNSKIQSLHPQVFSITLSNKVFTAAENAKISPGKLAAYLVAANEGYPVQNVNQLTGASLGQVLSNPHASSVIRILGLNDVKQVDQWLDGLQTIESSIQSSNVSGTTDPSNNGIVIVDGHGSDSGHPGDSGQKNGDGNGHDKHGKTGSTNNTTGTVQVQIGNRVVIIPVSPSPVIWGTGPQTNTSGDDRQNSDLTGVTPGGSDDGHHGGWWGSAGSGDASKHDGHGDRLKHTDASNHLSYEWSGTVANNEQP